jgi:TamB, inner membrane protein subunit of TAM complex
MKDIFFSRETWRLGGTGRLEGIFTMFAGGRDLTAEFSSDDARVNDLEFQDLHGALNWTQTRLAVLHAEARVLGGRTRFDYSLAPLGSPTGSMASFSADYADIDVFDLDRLMSLRGLRLAGLASGHVTLQWPNGKFATGRRGTGRTRITAPEGITLASMELPPTARPPAPEVRPFDGNRRTGPLMVGGDLHYRFDPAATAFENSWVATTHSYIGFGGRMLRDGTSQFPFHVTSHDWQESDRLLASIMTAMSGQTGAVEVGGRGTFDGVMTGSFSAPRITGTFAGEQMRVWDVTWGRGRADLVIEGGYVNITNSLIGDATGSSIVADGRYSLGFRKDDKEEIRARVKLSNWPLADLQHAFELDDWPMAGTIGAADLDLTGQYRAMFGTGTLRIDRGRAWDEPFDVATGALELEGTGLRVSRIDVRKGPGIAHGAARIGWDGTYAFNAEGDGMPVELLETIKIEQAPLSGQLKFKVAGAGEFERPTYTFEGSVDDLFVGSEGIGSLSGRFTVANEVMTVERLVAASSRLQVLGTGTIALDTDYTSDVRLRFSETALHPYLKFVLTDDISPYTRMVVGGALAVRGPLGRPKALSVDATIDDATVTLYDYDLKNDGPLALRFSEGLFRAEAFKLRGNGTDLALSGGGDVTARTLNMTATGQSNLAILQLFPEFSGVTLSGAATLNARLTGSFDTPRFSGDAVLAGGRIRPVGSPHSLDNVNGRIEFGANAITLDGVTGRIGNGDIDFYGSIPLDGYSLVRYDLTAQGRSMRLRYPEGFTSTVDMDLALTGPIDAPRLTGAIDVLRVALIATGGGAANPFGLAVGGVSVASTVAPSVSSLPLALDLRVTAEPMPFIDTPAVRIEGRGALAVRGTYDRPSVTGTIDVLGGEANILGNRYVVREGEISFRNPDVIDPIFNVAAEARLRVNRETVVVNVGLTGTLSRFIPTVESDPWLPTSDIYSLLAGATPDLDTAEQRALGSSEQLKQQLVQTLGAVLITIPLTSRVGSAVQQTGALDTVQITPVLTAETAFQQINTGARITLGKRISPRVVLTYTQTTGGGPQEQVIFLEYDQSDRMSWVLSRNQDRTFALDFRVRYVF